MEYIQKDLGAFKLHLIKTKKFKTNDVKIVFRRPIKKDEITIRNVLCHLLLQSSKEYDSKRKLAIKCQDLYSAYTSVNSVRFGNYINTTFSLNVLNDKYTEKGNFYNAIKFLGDIIFNPNVEDSKFDKDQLDIVKTNCRNSLNSIKEEVSGYCLIRLFEELDSTQPFSYRTIGYISDLDKINVSNLYSYYEDMINNDYVDIFLLGDYDIDEVVSLIKDTFKFRTIKKDKGSCFLEEKKVKSIREFKEEIDNTQSRLAIACRANNLSEYERNYVLTLYNVILGGCSDSKLFMDVREKNSLCYTIYSVPNKLDKLLLIQAGIDKENYEKTVELIKKNMDEMVKGKFSDNDINVAKEFYLTALEDIMDNPDRIINDYLMMEIIGTDPIDKKKEMIEKVSKDEIIKVAKKIKMDSIFFLEGVKDERD